jgi:hypothetical protein
MRILTKSTYQVRIMMAISGQLYCFLQEFFVASTLKYIRLAEGWNQRCFLKVNKQLADIPYPLPPYSWKEEKRRKNSGYNYRESIARRRGSHAPG